jgi:hypothetical protein
LIDSLIGIRDGDSSAKKTLLEYATSYSPKERLGYNLQNVTNEFYRMFSFEPGLTKGIDLLIELIEDIRDNHQKAGYSLYSHPAWGKLPELRSPFNFLTERECKACGRKYAHQVTGEFVDLVTFNCTECFNVYIGSVFEIDKKTTCSRQHELAFSKCPKCLSAEYINERSVSPYQYFMARKFFKKSDTCAKD